MLPRAALRGPPRGRGTATSTVAAAIAGIRTPPRPSGSAVWPSARRSASESASQRPSEALPIPRRYPRAPPKIRETPVNAVSQRHWPARSATPASAWTAIDGHPARDHQLLFRADYRCLPPGHGRGRGSTATSTPTLPRSRHSNPSTAGRAPPFGRQRAARRQSRPLSGPLRPFPTRGGTPAPPKIRKCPSTPVLSAAGPRDPPHRPSGPAIEGHPASDRRLPFRADYRCLPPGHRSRSRQHGNINTDAPAIAAFAPLYRRPTPPFRRQRAARRQSRLLSGPQRPFPTRGGTPGYPRTSEKCPSTPFLSAAGSARSARTGSAWTHKSKAPRAVAGCCSAPTTAACRRATGRGRGSTPASTPSRPRSRHSHPSTAGRHRRFAVSAPLGVRVSLSAAPLRPFPTRGGTPGYPRTSEKCPSTPFLSAAGLARFATPAPRTNHSTRRSASQMLLSSASRCRLHRSNHRRCSLLSQGGVPGTGNRPPWRTPAKWPLPLLTPSERSERSVRLIQKSHPAILAGAGSDHSPVAFYFRNGWLFSPEYALCWKAAVSGYNTALNRSTQSLWDSWYKLDDQGDRRMLVYCAPESTWEPCKSKQNAYPWR